MAREDCQVNWHIIVQLHVESGFRRTQQLEHGTPPLVVYRGGHKQHTLTLAYLLNRMYQVTFLLNDEPSDAIFLEAMPLLIVVAFAKPSSLWNKNSWLVVSPWSVEWV